MSWHVLARDQDTAVVCLAPETAQEEYHVVRKPGVFLTPTSQVIVNFLDESLLIHNLPAESTKFFNHGSDQPVGATTQGKSLEVPSAPVNNFMQNMKAAVEIAQKVGNTEQCVIFMPLHTGGELSEEGCDAVPRLQFLPDNTTFIFLQVRDEWVRKTPDDNGDLCVLQGLMPVPELRKAFSAGFPDKVTIQIESYKKRADIFSYMYGQAILPTGERLMNFQLPDGMKFMDPATGILTYNTSGASFVSQSNTAITVLSSKPQITAIVTTETAGSGSALSMYFSDTSLQEKLVGALKKFLGQTIATEKMIAVIEALQAVDDLKGKIGPLGSDDEPDEPHKHNAKMLLQFVRHMITPAHAEASGDISTKVFTVADGAPACKRARSTNHAMPVRQASIW